MMKSKQVKLGLKQKKQNGKKSHGEKDWSLALYPFKQIPETKNKDEHTIMI